MSHSWLRQRLASHIIVRLVVATVLLGAAIVVEVQTPGELAVNPFLFLIGFTFVVSLGSALALPFVDRYSWLVDLHFAVDAFIVTACVALTGGVGSLFTTLYALLVPQRLI